MVASLGKGLDGNKLERVLMVTSLGKGLDGSKLGKGS